jgi:hypothetical protein
MKRQFTYDLLDSEQNMVTKEIVLHHKQYQMRIGEIWQAVLGSYDGFEDLKSGHESSLDIMSRNRKIIVEIKNRTNTDNSSSRKTKLDKLAKFKKKNPDYTCIYAMINESTREKTRAGSIKKITHDGAEIEIQTGFYFLRFILGENTRTTGTAFPICLY